MPYRAEVVTEMPEELGPEESEHVRLRNSKKGKVHTTNYYGIMSHVPIAGENPCVDVTSCTVVVYIDHLHSWTKLNVDPAIDWHV